MSVSLAKYVLVFAGVVAASFDSTAAQASSWVGVMKSDNGKRTRVTAFVNAETVQLRFGEPANCTINANFLDVENGTSVYRFHVSQNGGVFCDRLYPGELMVTPSSTDSLHLNFRRHLVPWWGVLERGTDQ
ncbi:hypothetical protein HBF26_06270 [Luteibacter jiangsuensis]|uniref:Uncharacterized protein n=1 Tax=Luteibacter jiangsuensis TaxID=637577 RepID=A0ABX0Q4D1_9GAMM|nr:hypothetical protein [Luteibacter jiangsuensis]NID04482.1 hypothetical protein [Luteibacter jiangsuensis]